MSSQLCDAVREQHSNAVHAHAAHPRVQLAAGCWLLAPLPHCSGALHPAPGATGCTEASASLALRAGSGSEEALRRNSCGHPRTVGTQPPCAQLRHWWCCHLRPLRTHSPTEPHTVVYSAGLRTAESLCLQVLGSIGNGGRSDNATVPLGLVAQWPGCGAVGQVFTTVAATNDKTTF